MNRARKNPSWVDETLGRHWDALENLVGFNWMPFESGGVMQEYGCGYYGCVMPTNQGDLVAKITTDMSEAAFAAAALQIGRFPAGIVEYHRVIALPEKYRNKPVYLLWREPATHVGELAAFEDGKQSQRAHEYTRLFGYDSIGSLIVDLNDLISAGRAINDLLDDPLENAASLLAEVGALNASGRMPASRRAHATRRELASVPASEAFVVWLQRVSAIIQQLLANPMGETVGDALSFYVQHGLLLTDVHTGNIGERELGDDEPPELVITDPGNMVPLIPEHLEIVVPRL